MKKWHEYKIFRRTFAPMRANERLYHIKSIMRSQQLEVY